MSISDEKIAMGKKLIDLTGCRGIAPIDTNYPPCTSMWPLPHGGDSVSLNLADAAFSFASCKSK